MAAGGDLSRRALEALAAKEYKHDRLTKPELERLLGIDTSFQLDEFLKATVFLRLRHQKARLRSKMTESLVLKPG
jgi:hypothetical protein